jgi:FixJ family two-component response regulator
MSHASDMSKSADRPRSTKTEVLATPHVISLVDDDKSFRGAMARLIRSLGHSVAAFDSAEDFLMSDRVNETECLICDVRMPRMSGIELQRNLVAKDHRFPIIFVTAHPTQVVREEALAAGAIGFLSKPCDEDALIALLDQALRGPSAAQ